MTKNQQIKFNDIRNNTLFWYSYISCFNGFDDENEINIDEALETTGIVNSNEELYEWQKKFFKSNSFISGRINEKIIFRIEFKESEILYFLNDIYIGNLGGHFEAWFLTFEELIKVRKYNDLQFMLLLPMTGLEKEQVDFSRELIIAHLKSINKFQVNAKYIAECIINGLIITGEFRKTEYGIINNQNHSVRNIDKYPIYRKNVIELNKCLK